MNDFYIPPVKPDEIFHYGMPERSGRYPWGSGDRPYQRLEGKVSKMETRLRKRFARADKVTSSRQKVANRKFEQAVRKSNSILSTKRSEQRAFDRAAAAQRKVNQEEYRMSKVYQKYVKTFDKLNVIMDDDLKTKGLDYYDRVVNNSKQSYQIALARKVG